MDPHGSGDLWGMGMGMGETLEVWDKERETTPHPHLIPLPALKQLHHKSVF